MSYTLNLVILFARPYKGSPLKQEGWDRLGISVSGVCLVHCLLLPVVISALPMWTSARQVHGWLHPFFAVLLVPTTILALVMGYRRHRSTRVVTFMTIGLLLVLIAAFPALMYPGVVFETVLTMSGSVFLIGGHFINWRLSRNCRVDMRRDVASPLQDLQASDASHHVSVQSEV